MIVKAISVSSSDRAWYNRDQFTRVVLRTPGVSGSISVSVVAAGLYSMQR